MNKGPLQEIIRYLNVIASKVGAGAEEIWPWLVRQQIIDSVVAVLMIIGVWIVCVLICIIIIKWYKGAYREIEASILSRIEKEGAHDFPVEGFIVNSEIASRER